MLYFKHKPDAQFYFLIIGLITIVGLSLFTLPLLCINDYEIRTFTENGEIKHEKEILNTKQCFPVIKYFQEINIRKEKQNAEAIMLYTTSRYGDYNPSSSFNSSLILNSSSLS